MGPTMLFSALCLPLACQHSITWLGLLTCSNEAFSEQQVIFCAILPYTLRRWPISVIAAKCSVQLSIWVI